MTQITDKHGFTETLQSDTPEFRKFYDLALVSYDKGLELFNSQAWKTKDGWKLESQGHANNVDAVYSKNEPNIGKVFVLVAEFEISAENLFNEVYINCSATPTWNPTIADYYKIQATGTQTGVYYNRTNDAFGGLVKSREFIDTTCWRKNGDVYGIGGDNCKYENAPTKKGSVRGETVFAAMFLEPVEGKVGVARMTWFQCSDLKGLLPRALVDRSMAHLLLEYGASLRVHLKKKQQA